jgi:hypothetical protein
MHSVSAWNRLQAPAQPLARWALGACLLVVLSVMTSMPPTAAAEQPPPPCHPNATAAQDVATVLSRGDVTNVPDELKDRLAQLADRPHSILPLHRNSTERRIPWYRP